MYAHSLCFIVASLFEISHIDGLYIYNALRPRQNDHYFPADIFQRIFLNEKVRIFIQISFRFPEGPINDKAALVQINDWHRSGGKPFSEPMVVYLTDAYMRHSASTN